MNLGRKVHSWERASASHSWEAPTTGASESSDDESCDDVLSVDDPQEAGEVLIDYLVSLHLSGQLSAKAVCIASYWAAKAGAQGPASRYAFRPNAPTGHFARHLDTVMGIKLKEMGSDMLKVPVPRYTKWDGLRSSHDLPIQAPTRHCAKRLNATPPLCGNSKCPCVKMCGPNPFGNTASCKQLETSLFSHVLYL